MATSRRVFLNIVGGAAASSAASLGCGAPADDGAVATGGAGGATRNPGGNSGDLSGGAGSSGAPSQTGGAAGSGGSGGSTGGSAGSGGSSGGGQRNVEAGVDARAGGGAGGGATRDAAAGAGGSGGSGGSVTGAGGSGGSGGAGVGGAGGTGAVAGSPVLSFGDRPAGLIGQYANPSLRTFAEDFIVVGRDAKGLYAMTMVCSHAGCTLKVPDASGQLACPCHGSVFDRTGGVVKGPATQPLEHYGVEIDGAGNVIVHTNDRPTAAARTPVT